MIVTLVRIVKEWQPTPPRKVRGHIIEERLEAGWRISVGQVGYLVEGRFNSEIGEVVIETFTKDGKHGATYYHVPVTCVEQVLDRDWYDAFEKWYDKRPYIKIEAEFVRKDDAMYGVWLHVGQPQSGWLNYKHRLLGSEDVKDPNKLVEYWELIANQMGSTLVVVDPYVQALCLDYQEGNKDFTRYMTMWATNTRQAMEDRNAGANQ